MKVQKFLSFIIILILLYGISACSGSDNNTPDNNSYKPKESELSPVTLTFYITGEEKPDSKEVLNKVAEECDLNIRLEFKYLSNFSREIKPIISSDEIFDALYVGMPEFYDLSEESYCFLNMARDGVLKDITDLLPQYAPDIYGQLEKEEIEAAKIDGKLYAVPNLFPSAKSISVLVDWEYMQKYGISPIKTYDDYGNYLKTIKDNEDGVIPGQVNIFDQELFTIPSGYVLLDRALNLVYRWNDAEMKIIPWEQTPEFKYIMSMLADWQKKGYLAGDSDGVAKTRASFLEVGSLPREGPVKLAFGGKDETHQYDLCGYPLYMDKKIQRDSPIGNIFMKGAIAINAKSVNAERVLMFLNWVQSQQENNDLLLYGIKGKHYTLKEEKIIFPEDVKNISSSYFSWLNSPFRNLRFFRKPEGGDTIPDNFSGEYEKFINDHTSYAPHTGFLPDYRLIQNEVQNRAGKYTQLVADAFRRGIFKAEEMDNIIHQLSDAGTDKIVTEIQSQLDDWRAGRK